MYVGIQDWGVMKEGNKVKLFYFGSLGFYCFTQKGHKYTLFFNLNCPQCVRNINRMDTELITKDCLIFEVTIKG